ncbi:maleylpyruvate isomerase N-terminal domain-containing protein [Nocardioides litoris]|uniref:maleylpyruvate isomerase N-terminal domain-containing protein n=1 Tax=Nocardioides litoris TaxID=1926648 RepID=UPI0011224E93|nr:maleylpyruvate isomerase N-terminal domain-containing protein [Nocardioides litoris]
MTGGTDATAETTVTEWQAAYDRVRDLAREKGEAGLDVKVPATPDWTARQLLAHMVGVGHDAQAGQMPEQPDDDWTRGHVEQRRDLSVDQVLDAWAEDRISIEATVADDPGPLADLVIHEQDLRGAVGEPGARDTPGLALVRDVAAGQLAEAVRGRDPLRLESNGWTWQSHDGDPGLVLRAEEYDLFRAITSRRTEDELRSYVAAGDLDPYLDAFAGMGPLPERSLGE